MGDGGCSWPGDNSESPNPQCSDKIDNDGDGSTDGGDAGCDHIRDSSENSDADPAPAQCGNGKNDDNDELVDMNDDGCTSTTDNSEANP